MEAKAEQERKLIEAYEQQTQDQETKQPKLNKEEAKRSPLNKNVKEVEARPEYTFSSGDRYTGDWIKSTQIK